MSQTHFKAWRRKSRVSRRAAPLVLPVAEFLLVERQRGSQAGHLPGSWGRGPRGPGGVLALPRLGSPVASSRGSGGSLRSPVHCPASCPARLAAGTARFAWCGAEQFVVGEFAVEQQVLLPLEQQGLLACARLPSRSLQRQGETATAGRPCRGRESTTGTDCGGKCQHVRVRIRKSDESTTTRMVTAGERNRPVASRIRWG